LGLLLIEVKCECDGVVGLVFTLIGGWGLPGGRGMDDVIERPGYRCMEHNNVKPEKEVDGGCLYHPSYPISNVADIVLLTFLLVRLRITLVGNSSIVTAQRREGPPLGGVSLTLKSY